MLGSGVRHDINAPTDRTVHGWHEDSDGLTLVHAQDIPAKFTDWLNEKRKVAWENRNNTEYQHVASIPVIFIHKWLAEGFNAYTEDLKDVLKRVHREDLQGFLTTDKRVI